MKDITEIQQFQQFANLEFIAKQVVEGFITGLHKSPYHGFSVEFAEHRLYNKGESTKFIDWKLFARTEKLFVKKFEEETNLRSQLIIDTSSSMLFPFEDETKPKKIQFAAYCAAALIFLLRKQRDAVGLSFFDSKVGLHTPSRLSDIHSKRLFAELQNLLSIGKEGMNKTTSTAESLHEIADKINRRSLVIIFSDMLDREKPEDVYSALQHFKYNKHEVILFHVYDKKLELDFDYQNRPYRFIDMETEQEIKLNPNDLRKDYQEWVGNFFNEIKMKCNQYQIDFVDSDINKGFNQILLPYIIKRNKLF